MLKLYVYTKLLKHANTTSLYLFVLVYIHLSRIFPSEEERTKLVKEQMWTTISESNPGNCNHRGIMVP